MILGVGIDICDIKRIKEALNNQKFIERIFTEKERAYAESSSILRTQRYASCWAAKEAFLKAISYDGEGVYLKDIELLHRDNGSPYLKLSNRAERLFWEKGGRNIFVSVSHDGDYVAVVVVIEK